ncbi:MAG: TonB-dependent receptor [Brevinematales bacterium]|jgi:hypothetical protein
MKGLILSIILIAAASAFSYSASLTVKVTDGAIALEDANLTIPELKVNMLSDEKGLCVFRDIKPGTCTIYAELPGFDRYSNRIEMQDSNLNIDIRLKHSVYSLGEINVVSKRNKGKVENQTTVGKDELGANSQGIINDAFKTLQLMPGVSSGGGALDSTMYIQGGNSYEWIAYMDGIFISDPTRWGGPVSISMFNPSVVDSIDLYTAGYPSRYGQGLSGIVDVSTINGSRDRWKGFIDVSPIEAEMLAEGPLASNFTIALDLRGTSYALYAPFVAPKASSVIIQWPYLYDGILKACWDISPEDKLTFDVYSSLEGVQINLGNNTNNPGYSASGDFQYQVLNAIGSARYTHQINSLGDSFDITAGAMPTIDNEQFNMSSTIYEDIIYGQYLYQLSSDYNLNSIKGHKIQAGGMVLYANPLYGSVNLSTYELTPQGVWTNNENLNYTLSPLQETYYAAYLTDNWEFIPSLILELGGREEYFSLNNEYDFNPQAGLKWEATRDLDFYIRAGRYSLFPLNYSELNSFTGNPGLQSEKVYHAITGLDYSDNGYVFKMEGFYKYYYDLDEDDSFLNINNNGIRNVFGGDIYLQKKQRKGDWLSGWISYTYVNGLEEITGRSPENPSDPYVQPLGQYFVPDYLRSHTISAIVQMTYYKNPDKPVFLDFLNQWQFSFELSAMSGVAYTPVTNFVSADVNGYAQYYYENGSYDSQYTPWYVRVDLKLTIPFNAGWLIWLFGPDVSGYVYLEVLNALDNDNVLSYRYTASNGVLMQTEEKDIPLIPLGGFRIEF